jgi:hypothetical protein
MVKVFFIPFSSAAVGSAPVMIVAPTAAEPAKTTRREGVSLDMRVKTFFAGAVDLLTL